MDTEIATRELYSSIVINQKSALGTRRDKKKKKNEKNSFFFNLPNIFSSEQDSIIRIWSSSEC